MAEIQVVCVRIADARDMRIDVSENSAVPCQGCGEKVWLAFSTQIAAFKEDYMLKVMCNRCVNPFEPNPGFELLPDQYAMLIEEGYSPAEIEALLKKLRGETT